MVLYYGIYTYLVILNHNRFWNSSFHLLNFLLEKSVILHWHVRNIRAYNFICYIVTKSCYRGRYCPRCKEQRQASKKLDLWRLPDVLVIHLKRFSFSRSTKQKLETFVNFPIHDLDLTNYIANKKSSERQIYELYAVSNHYGSMASGHYTAHIKVCISEVFLY
jgi:uncharacterized UBP type Zn finger protein